MLITLTGKSRNKTKQWSGKEFQKKCRIFGSFWLDKKLQITFLPFVANAERIQKQQTKEWSDSEGWWSVEFVTGLQTRTRSLPMAQFLWKRYLNSLKFFLMRETDKKQGSKELSPRPLANAPKLLMLIKLFKASSVILILMMLLKFWF